MLISFKFNNFCSFNLESEFSMEAPNSKVKTRYPDNYTSTEVDYDNCKEQKGGIFGIEEINFYGRFILNGDNSSHCRRKCRR